METQGLLTIPKVLTTQYTQSMALSALSSADGTVPRCASHAGGGQLPYGILTVRIKCTDATDDRSNTVPWFEALDFANTRFGNWYMNTMLVVARLVWNKVLWFEYTKARDVSRSGDLLFPPHYNPHMRFPAQKPQ